MNKQVKQEGSSELGKVFLVLGIGCFILAAIGCGTFYYFVGKARGLGADFARAGLVKVVNDTALPEEQKTGVIGHIDRVTKSFKDGDMSLEEVGKLFEELGESPLLPAGMLYHVHAGYVMKSELGPLERGAAVRMAQRYARGAIEGSIPNSKTNAIIKMVQVRKRTTRGGSRTEFKESLTEQEFAAFHQAIVDEVTARGIPDEPYEIDVSGEIGKIVDRALKK